MPRTRTAPPTLSPKLQSVLVRLCKRAPGKLTITQAVKLPYLVDVLANRVLGRPITDGHHQAWQRGVVTSEAWHFLSGLPEEGPLEVVPSRISEEIWVQVPDGVAEDELADEERRIVDFVVAEYGFASATELGALTKRMNPAIRSWGGNHRADLGGDAYERMSPDYLEMIEAIEPVTLERLRRESTPLGSLEDAIA